MRTKCVTILLERSIQMKVGFTMKRIIAICLLVFILMLGVSLDTGISGLIAYWNIPSLLVVGIIVISMLMLSDNISDFFRGFNIVMTDKAYTTKELKASHNAIDTGIKLTYLSGIVGLIIGMIGLLSRLDDPSAIGPALAVAMLTVLYAALINIILYASRAKIKKELIYRKKMKKNTPISHY